MAMVVFCLHYLGGSAREWARVTELLASEFPVVAIDLPGFGDAAQTPGYTVAEMAAYVSAAIGAHAPTRWMLAGHSMGAKVATAVARDAEDGAPGLRGLAGLLLLAGSPPSPEPMEDEQRRKMLGWFRGDDASRRAQAHEFVASNSEAKLSASDARMAEGDVLRCNRDAWVAWLEGGSREDWSQRIGVLRTPAVAIAGAEDPQLGPDAQKRLMLPHFADASLVTLPGAKHLLPMECAQDVAALFLEHARTVAYRDLIASSRVSRKTREALASRDRADAPAYAPAALEATTLTTLRAIVERVVPQTGAVRIDLAARIDERLSAAHGDGWRFARLPADVEAYRRGLATIEDISQSAHGTAFASLDDEQRDEILRHVVAGTIGADVVASDRLSVTQMRLWFEDVRADAVQAYIGHPRTLARLGYSGIANGGDGQPKSGFARVGLGQREAWEPTALRDLRS